MYIAIEGLDRSGKSSVAREVVRLLREEHGLAVLAVTEPSHDNFQGRIRSLLMDYPFMDPYTEVFLFLADRAASNRAIEQVNNSTWVVADRCYLSTLAYQGRAIDENRLRQMMDPWLKKPDKLFVLDAPENLIASRRTKDHRDPASMAEIVFLRDRYNRLTKEENGVKLWVGSDECGQVPSPEKIARKILASLDDHLM